MVDATKFLFKEVSNWLRELRNKGHVPGNHISTQNVAENRPQLTAK